MTTPQSLTEEQIELRLAEALAQRDALAHAFDKFFYDLAYTAPEAIGDRLTQLGNRIRPVIEQFAELPIKVGSLKVAANPLSPDVLGDGRKDGTATEDAALGEPERDQG